MALVKYGVKRVGPNHKVPDHIQEKLEEEKNVNLAMKKLRHSTTKGASNGNSGHSGFSK